MFKWFKRFKVQGLEADFLSDGHTACDKLITLAFILPDFIAIYRWAAFTNGLFDTLLCYLRFDRSIIETGTEDVARTPLHYLCDIG